MECSRNKRGVTLEELANAINFYYATHKDEGNLTIVFDGLLVAGKFSKQTGKHPCLHMY